MRPPTRKQWLSDLLGAGCGVGLVAWQTIPALAVQYVFYSGPNGTGSTSGATYTEDNFLVANDRNGVVSGSFTFTSPGGVPTFTNISVTATCFEGSTTSTTNPCDLFGPNNDTNTVTFTNIVQYSPGATSTIVFNNLDQTGSDVLRVRFTGGGLVNAVGQTRNVTTAATPNDSFFCSSSSGNPRVNCEGDEQARFDTFSGSLLAVPSPFSALLLLPLGPLALLRRRLRTRLSGMNA